MAGYKMKSGSKNYTIKSYRDGGLVETKEYKDGKTVVTEDERMKAMQEFLNEDTSISTSDINFDSKTDIFDMLILSDYLQGL